MRWAPVPGATTYEYAVLGPGDATLLRSDVPADSGTTATVTGLPLELGQVYYFGVRAISPSGRSSETLSDGIEVVDRTPPELNLTAAPRPFSPDGDGVDDIVRITASMRDNRGLDAWSLTIAAADGQEVRRFAPLAATGKTEERVVDWDGLDAEGSAVPQGVYRAVAVVRDAGANETSAEVLIELDLSGPVDGGSDAADLPGDADDVPGPEDGFTDSLDDVGEHDASVQDTSTADDGEPDNPTNDVAWAAGGGGCGCRMSPNPAARLAVLLLILVVACRRRPS